MFLLASTWCIHTVVLTLPQLRKIPERSDFHLIDNLSVAVIAFAGCMLLSLSVDDIFLPRYVNCSTVSSEKNIQYGNEITVGQKINIKKRFFYIQVS